MNNAVKHNREHHRFEIILPDNNEPAVLEYKMMHGDLALLHTYVPHEERGQGLADELAQTALEYARAEGLKVRPYCQFVASYLDRHEEYAELVNGV